MTGSIFMGVFSRDWTKMAVQGAVTAAGLALSLSVTEPAQAQQCSNFVGTVCLDKKPAKKAPAKKKRKKAVRAAPKPVKEAPPEEPVVKEVTAESCIVLVQDRLGLDWYNTAQRVRYVFRNTCKKNVTAYMTLSPCFKGTITSDYTTTRKRVAIKGGRRKTVELLHADKIFGNGQRAVEVVYSFGKAKYPKWTRPC